MVSQYFPQYLCCVFLPTRNKKDKLINHVHCQRAREWMPIERSRYILKYTAHIAVLYTFSGSHYFPPHQLSSGCTLGQHFSLFFF